ncbi:MAG: hypothetical protein R3C20_02600 [Planctomycetaceae bacterium]
MQRKPSVTIPDIGGQRHSVRLQGVSHLVLRTLLLLFVVLSPIAASAESLPASQSIDEPSAGFTQKNLDNTATGRNTVLPPLRIPVSPQGDGDSQPPMPVTLSDEAHDFLRGMILLLLPEEFSDDDGWGNQRRIQSGLNVDISRGKLHTSRRWKNVNHGVWARVSARLVNPENTFQLRVTQLPNGTDEVAAPSVGTGEFTKPESTRYSVECDVLVKAIGQRQQWNWGLSLWSVSADVDVGAKLLALVNVGRTVRTIDGKVQLRITPVIDTAEIHITHFRVNRISHVKGNVAREIGEMFQPLVMHAVRKANSGLAGKINRKIEKLGDRLNIPLWNSVFPSPTESSSQDLTGQENDGLRSE